MLLATRNDPSSVILVDLLPPVPPWTRVIEATWFLERHNGRTRYRDQSATNDDDAWKSESRRCRARGLIKKPRLTREKHVCTESRSTALEGIHVGYLHGSAPTGAGLIFGCGQGRRRRRKTPQREGSAFIFIRRSNDRARSVACYHLGSPTSRFETTMRGRLARFNRW